MNYRIGRFVTTSPGTYLRIAAGAGLLIGLGTPLYVTLAKVLPRRDLHRLARAWAAQTRRFLGMEMDIEGLEQVDPDRQYVVAPLHEGFADALLLAKLPLDLRFVIRDELFEWSLLGRVLTASDQIAVTPENRVSGYRSLLQQARRSVHRGESLVVFPQGSILGIEAAFQSGAFRIADHLGLPLLPVVITGTHRVWDHPYSGTLRFGQRVSMRVLKPLPTGEAVSRLPSIETTMKTIARSGAIAAPRHFDPDRDGYWDDYSYEIDPTFSAVAARVAAHRAAISRSMT